MTTMVHTSALAECEATISLGMSAFVQVGVALRTIRDERLYRETHPTFEDYCQDRWNMDRRNANRTIESADITEALGSMDPKLTPANVRQARELSGLPPERAAAVMAQAHAATNGHVTAKAIREVVNTETGEITEADTQAPKSTAKELAVINDLRLYFGAIERSRQITNLSPEATQLIIDAATHMIDKLKRNQQA